MGNLLIIQNRILKFRKILFTAGGKIHWMSYFIPVIQYF